VIGGGAAGIQACITIDELLRQHNLQHKIAVDLYERNKRLGIKILISGGGRCNITHSATPTQTEEGFIPQEARFMRFSLHKFTAQQVLEQLNLAGLETYTRPNGRVFPVTENSEDVLSTFENILYNTNTNIFTNSRVLNLEYNNAKFQLTYESLPNNISKNFSNSGSNQNTYKASKYAVYDAVIIATGGKSYSKTGCTGDGIFWAEKLGHKIEKVRPALAPIYFQNPLPTNLHGVSIRGALLKIQCEKKIIDELRKLKLFTFWQDDFVITHKGISGPSVLEISRYAHLCKELSFKYNCPNNVSIKVDFIPETPHETLLSEWNKLREISGNTIIKNFASLFLPTSLAEYILTSAEIDIRKTLNSATKLERDKTLQALKNSVLGEIGIVDIERGEVTAGGVALSEVDSQTMQSKIINGLFIAGEALDIAGRVGGYNLQAAFSSGFVAGCSVFNFCN